MLEDYRLDNDAALVLMGKIIHGAGLRAIAFGFMYKYGLDDQAKIAAQMEMYDALYLYCKERTGGSSGYTAML